MKMTSNVIKYRRGERKDIKQLAILMNSQYARQKTEAYFEWQFFSSPYPTVLTVAEKQDKIIGMFGLQNKLLTDGTKIGQLIDLLVSSEYRRQGVFSQLAKLALSYSPGVAALTVFANKYGKQACEKKLGMKTIAQIDTLVGKQLSCCDVPSDFTERDKELISIAKNKAWREWRYSAHPEYEYSKISANNSFAFTKIFRDPLTNQIWGDVVETESTSQDHKNFFELFTLICKHFTKEKVQGITTWALPHTTLYKFLIQSSFIKRSEERYFCLKILDRQCTYLDEIKNWHLCQADAEIF